MTAAATALLISLAVILWNSIEKADEKGFYTERLETIKQLERELVTLSVERNQAKYDWKSFELEMNKNAAAMIPTKRLELSYRKLKYDFAVLRYTEKSAEIANLKAVSFWDTLIHVFREQFVPCFLHAFYLVLLIPILWKIIMYYLVARLIELVPPVKAKKGDYEKSIQFLASDVSLDHTLNPGEKLYLRSGDWGKKRTDLKASTKFFWSWKFPLVSIAADLVELVEFRCTDKRKGRISITSPKPDLFIGKIQLAGESGMVIRPRYLVGVTDQIRIRTRWSFNLHNLISGRVRQIILYGNGTVFVVGSWGVDSLTPENSQDSRIEENLTIAYETKAEYSLCRTETFWHYLRGNSCLFDLRLRNGAFLTQNNAAAEQNEAKNVFERIFSGVLNGIGSFLGF